MEKSIVKSVFIGVVCILVGMLIGFNQHFLRANRSLMSRLLQEQDTLSRTQKELGYRLLKLENEGKELKEAFDDLKAKIPARPPEEDYSKVYQIDIAHSPVLGKKDAVVTITEFVDFQCPFCARFHPVVLEAQKAFPGKVNVVLKHFPLPFHQAAIPAAKAALAAGEQGKYWEMVDGLLKNNKDLTEKKFKELAKGLGLNVAKFMKDYTDKNTLWQTYIQEDMSLGEKSQVRGTPTIYINGRKTKARGIEGFKEEINKLLAEKKE